MAYLYNKTTGRNVQVVDSAVKGLLNKPNSPYLPVAGSTYEVSHSIYGNPKSVSGGELYAHLNSGYEIVDNTKQRAREYVRETSSPVKQFLGNFVDEAATLGLYEEIKNNLEKDPTNKLLIDAERDEFGTSKFLGGLAGFVVPAALTGGGSLLAKGGAKAGLKGALSKLGQAAGKGAKVSPVNALIKASHSAGKAGAKGLGAGGAWAGGKLAGKTGSKIGGVLGKGAGYVGASAVAEGAVYGGGKLAGSAVEDLLSGEQINIKDAFGEGLDRGVEIFKYSGLVGSILVGGGAGVYGAYKGIGALAHSSAGRKTTNFIKNGISKGFRSNFFNKPKTATAKEELIKSAKRGKESLLNLPDEDIVTFYKNLPDDVKQGYPEKPTIKTIKDILADVIEKGKLDEGDIFGLYANILKKNNNGKYPLTIKEAAKILKTSEEKVGKKIGKVREQIQEHQKFAQKEVKIHQRRVDVDVDIPKYLSGGEKRFESLIKDFLKITPESLLPKVIKDFKTTIKGSVIPTASDNAGKWLLQVLDGNLDNVLNFGAWAKNNPKLFKQKIINPLKKQGLKDQEIKTLLIDAVSIVENSKSSYGFLADALRLKRTFNKAEVNYKDVKFLKDIRTRRNVDINNKIDNIIDEYIESGLNKSFFATKEKWERVIKGAKAALSEIQKSAGASQYYNKLKNVERILEKQKNVTLTDVREVKEVFDDLAKFDKLKGETATNKKARKFARQLSDLEDEIIKDLAESNSIAPNVKKQISEIKKLKGEYSLIKTVQKYAEQLESTAISIGWRDVVFLGGGGYVGGAAGTGIGLAVSQASRRGIGFLHLASAMDNISSNVKRGLDLFRSVSNPKKLNIFFNRNQFRTYSQDIVTFPQLGKILGVSASVTNLETLALEIDRNAQDINYYMELGAENYGVVRKNGGEKGVAMYSKSMGDFVTMVKQLMPKGHTDPITRKRTFTKDDELNFRLKMNLFARPDSFLHKAKQGNLSDEERITFQSFYPKHYDDFIQNFVYAVQNKDIKLTRGILSTYNRILGLHNPTNLVGIDNNNRVNKENELKQARQGGIKFKSTEQNHQSLGNRIENL